MLTDAAGTGLREDERSEELPRVGVNGTGADILPSGDGEVRPDVTLPQRCFFRFARSRMIRKELTECANRLLVGSIDYLMEWPGILSAVEDSCDRQAQRCCWMRNDEPRIDALLPNGANFLDDPGLCELMKD